MRRVRAGMASLLSIVWMLSSGAANPSDGDAPAPRDVESLMKIFAESGAVQARFRESRHLAILTDPIETGGMLYYAPPDRLARHTTRPGRSSIVVEAGRVSFGDETGQRTFDVNTSEVARTLIGNLLMVFGGDIESLRARFSVSFHSDGALWTLELEPRSRAVRSVIERIRFTGTGRTLTATETLESNGDRTITRLSDIRTGVVWDPPELERIFSLEATEAAP